MNPFTMPTVCHVCGERGMAIPTLGNPYTDFRHSNPEYCASVLKCKREQLDRERKELEKNKEAAK
jgi:hypothetical protein